MIWEFANARLVRFASGVVLAATVIAVPPAAIAEAPPPTPAQALALEQSDALPITKFYDTPPNLSASKPGDLLRSEKFSNYILPPGATAVRILYRSLDAEGRAVATSGVVLIPAGKAPASGWPVIAWAHGTSGVARLCAPSAMKDVYYGDEGLDQMLKAGFAVVATDYHGLGTEGPHQYVNKTAQAYDVIYSIPAARAAVPVLGSRWVVDGHSQGGLAAWGVAEMEFKLKDPNYLAAVSVAGATHLQGLLTDLANAKSAGFYMPFIAFGVAARFTDFSPATMLSERALKNYQNVSRNGCWLYGYATYAGEPPGAMVKPGWNELPAVRAFVAESLTTEKPVTGPILVIAGEADQSVAISGVRATVASACRKQMNVTFRSYPGLDHDPTMTNSTPDQLAWIRDRFEGKPATGNCPRK
jgi:pimeloyl-ACP methyl ester carboxylesterase